MQSLIGKRDATQREVAYDQLRRAILGGELPPGTPLSEPQVAVSLGVSRTPVREALLRLSQDGLVDIVPGRGAAVARLSVEDAREIYQVREALEGLAARLAAPVIGEATVARLEQAFATQQSLRDRGQPDLAAQTAIGQELHTAIVEAAQNTRIALLLGQMQAQIALALRMAATVPGRVERSFEQHREILAALRRRDGEAAELAMRRHLISTGSDLLRSRLGRPLAAAQSLGATAP